MAKISQLPAASSLTGTELIPVVQSNTTKSSTLTVFRAWLATIFAAITGNTGSLVVPSGTTAQQDAAPVAGYTRWNTTLTRLETYFNATLTWVGTLFTTSPTGSAIMPTGTTAQRDSSPSFGYTRGNSTLSRMEWWNGSSWAAMGGGATGGGTDTVFNLNSLIVTTSYTLPTGYNANSVGPITINTGVSVTVPSGQRWVIL
jgi:hypothetical protein